MKNFWQAVNGTKAVKIAVGAVIAILIAEAIGLQNPASAGIITLLTVQNTRLETVMSSVRRFAAFGIMTGCSLPIYHFCGTQPWAFGIVLLILLLSCYVLHLEDAASINAVMATHYMLAGGVTLLSLGNAVLLLIIGSGIGVGLNWFMPSNLKKIRTLQQQLDAEIRGILYRMAAQLRQSDHSGYEDSCFQRTQQLSTQLYQETQIYLKNQTWEKDIYFMRYVSMRRDQCAILYELYTQILQLTDVPEQALSLSQLIEQIGAQFHEGNDCADLLAQLEHLHDTYRAQPLPETRAVFENRAILYGMLIELRILLQKKRMFFLSLPEKERERLFTEFVHRQM